MPSGHRPQVVIIGGGFGGLYAAKRLTGKPVDVTLIDRRNHHLFQPLLYQVATGGLSASDIAYPLRAVLKRSPNVKVLKTEAKSVDPGQKCLVTSDGSIPFDYLIVATGVRHHYFGNRHWETFAPGLKSIADAWNIRRKVINAFEEAEKEPDPVRRQALMRFVIVGGGPTGVELAGALGELSHSTLKGNFRNIDPAEAEIYLMEGGSQLLASYPEDLARKACRSLERLGVTVKTQTMVTRIDDAQVDYQSDGQSKHIEARTVLWAAGVTVTSFGKALAEKTGAETDRAGRIWVAEDLSIAHHPDIFVIGDLASFKTEEEPLPGIAPVAMQQGKHVARVILNRLQGKAPKPFRYADKGQMAVIGRNAAVAQLPVGRLWGWMAWVIWAAVHIHFLIEFGNKFLVSFQWGWNYVTKKQSARVISDRAEHLGGGKGTVTGQNHETANAQERASAGRAASGRAASGRAASGRATPGRAKPEGSSSDQTLARQINNSRNDADEEAVPFAKEPVAGAEALAKADPCRDI